MRTDQPHGWSFTKKKGAPTAPLLGLVLGANTKLLAEFTIPPNVLLGGVSQETITLTDELQ